jgi:hypothetical protein
MANNNTNIKQCLLAKEIILTAYAQFARIVLMIFNTIPVIIFIFLVKEYKKYKIALHGNLKVFYF